jgi:hypothetical protein
MDRNQQVVERARVIFGDRIDDVAHMARQDRQDLRGWEEPAHLRAVVRRRVRENGDSADTQQVAVADAEFSRGAAEPDRGQQREGIGQLLEAGARGLERLSRDRQPQLTQEERFGLECVLLIYGRPAVLVNNDRLASVPAFWNQLQDQSDDVEVVQRGVGRIELFGHPECDWAGTACLVSDTVLMTTRRTAELFIEPNGPQYQFRPGITAWMDYRGEYQQGPNAGYRVRNVIGLHPTYDLALLEVEPPQTQSAYGPTPLSLAAQPPGQVEGRPVYMVGYPVRDARRNEPEALTRVFRDLYNVKRVQPGQLRGTFTFRDVQLLRNDCGLLGSSAGSCLVDLETHQVLGLQLTSRYLEPGTAIPLWALRDDPLFRQASVSFTDAPRSDLQTTLGQLERLARSRYWNELRRTVEGLYQRAFGGNNNPPPRTNR